MQTTQGAGTGAARCATCQTLCHHKPGSSQVWLCVDAQLVPFCSHRCGAAFNFKKTSATLPTTAKVSNGTIPTNLQGVRPSGQVKSGKDIAGKKRKRGAELQPPAKPRTAFNFFSEHEQAQAASGEIAKDLTDKWKTLPYSEKEPFVKLALEDKARYDKELEAYKNGEDYTDKPKKPKTSYLMFLDDFRERMKDKIFNNKELVIQGTKSKGTANITSRLDDKLQLKYQLKGICKLAGKEWHTMNADDRAPYVQKATEEKEKYDKLHAEYVKKNGMRK